VRKTRSHTSGFRAVPRTGSGSPGWTIVSVTSPKQPPFDVDLLIGTEPWF
jgi:hypothetical protein